MAIGTPQITNSKRPGKTPFRGVARRFVGAAIAPSDQRRQDQHRQDDDHHQRDDLEEVPALRGGDRALRVEKRDVSRTRSPATACRQDMDEPSDHHQIHCGDHGDNREHNEHKQHPRRFHQTMSFEPELALFGLARSSNAPWVLMQTVDRDEQIVRPVGGDLRVGKLSVPGLFAHHPVQQSRRDTVAEDGLHRREIRPRSRAGNACSRTRSPGRRPRAGKSAEPAAGAA